MKQPQPQICIFGAGSIGCYIGGRLADAGARIRLIGREKLAKEIAAHGLHLTDYLGANLHVAARDVDYRTDPQALADATLILVTVKAGDTAEAAKTLAKFARPDAIIVSFQNGIGNEETLRAGLPGRTVLAGMVPFNVVRLPGATFRQATEGALDIEQHAALEPFLTAFERAGLPLKQHAEFRPVQWGKLLLNLNNAINGLSGLPLREQLSQRAYRQCLALAQSEALRVMKAAGIQPTRLMPLPPHWVPHLLALPDRLFLLIAGRMLSVDISARSSMIDALDAGRPTDVDWLNGEVVRLAARVGLTAPVNARLVELIHSAERGGQRRWSGPELLERLRSPA
jgi:2-dehydropantoate 2-reductase